MMECLWSLEFIKRLKSIPTDYPFKKVWLPTKKRICVFDMDETLMHTVDSIKLEGPQHIIRVKFPEEAWVVTLGVNIWPFATECLRVLSEHFFIVVWTSAIKEYADEVLNIIDPHNEFIQRRYYWTQCVKVDDSIFVKDLWMFEGIDLKDIVIVDNSVYSFGF